MKCQRCYMDEGVLYQVYTDLIDIKVCGTCAEIARELGIAVEVLDGSRKKGGRARREKKMIQSHPSSVC